MSSSGTSSPVGRIKIFYFCHFPLCLFGWKFATHCFHFDFHTVQNAYNSIFRHLEPSPWYNHIQWWYSLIQKNGDKFSSVYSSECVTVFLNQTILLLGFIISTIKLIDLWHNDPKDILSMTYSRLTQDWLINVSAMTQRWFKHDLEKLNNVGEVMILDE